MLFRTSPNRRRTTTHLARLVTLVALTLSACSGDTSPDDTATDRNDGADISTDTTVQASASDSAPTTPVDNGPINGIVTSAPSTDLGLHVFDRESGEQVTLGTTAAIDFVDRDKQPILGGDATFTLGYTARADQSFSNDVSLVRIDLASGSVDKIAELGFDRERDDAPGQFTFDVLAASATEVIVAERESGMSQTNLRSFDAATGEERGSFTTRYDISGDDGSCSGDVDQLRFLEDGRLLGMAGDVPALVDTATGEISLLPGCSVRYPDLSEYVDVADFERAVVVRDGDTFDPAQIERFLAREISPSRSGDVATGDGSLFWITDSSPDIDGSKALQASVVQFDLATEAVVGLWPLGALSGEFVDCPQGGDSCEISTFVPQMRFFDGHLVMVDPRESAPVLVLDPMTGTVTTIDLEVGDGVDFTRAALGPADAQAMWVEVDRMTIVNDDDSGRTSSGTTYFDRIDPSTGTVVLSVAGEL